MTDTFTLTAELQLVLVLLGVLLVVIIWWLKKRHARLRARLIAERMATAGPVPRALYQRMEFELRSYDMKASLVDKLIHSVWRQVAGHLGDEDMAVEQKEQAAMQMLQMHLDVLEMLAEDGLDQEHLDSLEQSLDVGKS